MSNTTNTATTPKLDIKVHPLNDQNNSTKAFASLTVDDLIAIRGIRIIEGSKWLFVTMPQSKDKDGNYHDIAFPVTGDLRKSINKAVLDEYKDVIKTAEKSANTKKTATPTNQKSSADEPDLFR